MARVRIYVPLTPAAVAGLATHRRLEGPLHAHAVTDALRSVTATEDEEEREHTALLDAAASSGALRGALPHKRIVASADVDASAVEDLPVVTNGPLTVVRVAGPVALRDIASFHLDEEAGSSEDELLWYDASELADVVSLTS